jgi:hypothetical protein
MKVDEGRGGHKVWLVEMEEKCKKLWIIFMNCHWGFLNGFSFSEILRRWLKFSLKTSEALRLHKMFDITPIFYSTNEIYFINEIEPALLAIYIPFMSWRIGYSRTLHAVIKIIITLQMSSKGKKETYTKQTKELSICALN